jgi:hypothetical protein
VAFSDAREPAFNEKLVHFGMPKFAGQLPGMITFVVNCTPKITLFSNVGLTPTMGVSPQNPSATKPAPGVLLVMLAAFMIYCPDL